jgi:hypothetical protein
VDIRGNFEPEDIHKYEKKLKINSAPLTGAGNPFYLTNV